MPFKKGRKKTGGRTKGTPNKHKKEFLRQLEAFCLDNFQEFIDQLNKIEDPKDKVAAYLKVFPYVVAQQKQIELGSEEQSIHALNITFKGTGIQPIHDEDQLKE